MANGMTQADIEGLIERLETTTAFIGYLCSRETKQDCDAAVNEAIALIRQQQERIAELESKNYLLGQRVQEVLGLVKNNAIKTFEVGGSVDVPPHNWHDEWAVRARKALGDTND